MMDRSLRSGLGAHSLLALLIVARAAVAAPGDLDPTWGAGGTLTTPFGDYAAASALVLQPDGKVVAGGYSGTVLALARYDRSGMLDPTFGTAGRVTAPPTVAPNQLTSLVLQPDGRLVAAGFTVDGELNEMALARYQADGTLDRDFGDGGHLTIPIEGYSTASANAVVLQPDGKLVVAGTVSVHGEVPMVALARIDPDGSLDSTFDGDGVLTTPIGVPYGEGGADALVRQPDGKLVAAGFALQAGAYEFALVRYNTDGSPDNSFGNNGIVTTPVGSGYEGLASALVRQPDGKLVAAGTAYGDPDSDFTLLRYLPDGSLDETFGDGGKVTTPIGARDEANALVLQPDGKLVAAGTALIDGNYRFALARYEPDGTLDETFGDHGKMTVSIGTTEQAAYALVMQPDDGKLIAAGGYSGAFALARFEGGPYLCGNGSLEPGEQCDDGNVVAGDCCSSGCQYEPAGTTCRGATGPCDAEETCTGDSGSCPADGYLDAGQVCRATAGVCDVAERCSGDSASCPQDRFKPGGIPCRESSGEDCDLQDFCSGDSPVCPDKVREYGTPCRDDGIACLDDICNGVDKLCTHPLKNDPGCPCATDADCDDGTKCTIDQCRLDVHVCVHAPGNAGVICREAAGLCDVAETCRPGDATCPDDVVWPATVTCRPADGSCDEGETCTGSTPECPPDALKPPGAVCREVAGDCDVREECDGTSRTCPRDAVLPAGVSCRTAQSACDEEEVCDGASIACPDDGQKAPGDSCDDEDPETGTSSCTEALECRGVATRVDVPPEIRVGPNESPRKVHIPVEVDDTADTGSHRGRVVLQGFVDCLDLAPPLPEKCGTSGQSTSGYGPRLASVVLRVTPRVSKGLGRKQGQPFTLVLPLNRLGRRLFGRLKANETLRRLPVQVGAGIKDRRGRKIHALFPSLLVRSR